MATNYNITESAQIASNPGNLTDEVFGVGAAALKRGELCYLAAGKIVPAVTTPGTAQALEATTAPFDGAKRWFISLEAQLANATKAKVIEIKENTILEGFVVTSNENGDVTTPAVTSIGVAYRGYVDANGRFAVEKNSTTNPVFVIADVDTNYQPYRHPDSAGFDTDAGGVRHGRVKFRLLKTLFAN